MPDFEQQDLAGGGAPARERLDIHVMGDQDDGLPAGQAEQEFPKSRRLRAGPASIPEERVERGQFLDRAQAEEPGRVAAAAPLAGENPVDASRRQRGSPFRSPAPAPCRCASRLRWVAQSSRSNDAGSLNPGASAWRMMATTPGSDRRAKRMSAAVGAEAGPRAASRATARSRRFKSSRPQSPANAINRPQTSAPGQQTIERTA